MMSVAAADNTPVSATAQPTADTERAVAEAWPDNAPNLAPNTLENIVVTATRLDTTLRESGRSMALIDRLTIETVQAQSVAQTLQYQANISIAGGPRAANQAVNIRGLTGNKVLQTVDGARQNFESGHRPSYFLDPELLARVEAVRGPVSSLWGSGAMGGVVAQRTIRAEDMLGGERSNGGFLKSGYNSNNQQSTTTAALLGRSDRADWLLSGYYRDSDDLELGNGDTLEGSASQNQGVLAKYRQQFGPTQSIEVIYRGATFEGAVPSNGEAELNTTSNFLLTRDQQTHNASIDYRFNPASDWLDSRLLAYVNTIEMNEARVEDRRLDNTELNTVGINWNNRMRWGAATLLTGIDAYKESFSATRAGADRPTPPDADTQVWSVYAQAQLPLSDSWRLDAGLRYDSFRTEADNLNDRRSDGAASPSLALSYTPSDWATLTLRHDRAFRSPSAEELYSTGTHFCMGPGFCNRFTPNSELAPERAANTELLGRLNFSNVLGADSLSIEASVFENRVDDFIEQIVAAPSFMRRPDPGTTRWINVDEATLRGAELSANYQRDALSLRVAYGLTRGEDNNSGEDLSNIPADTFNLDLGYAWVDFGVLTGLRLTHAADQTRINVPELAPNTQFDGYTVLDIYGNWSPRSFSALRFDLNVNNIGNEFYQRAWDQLPQAGREVIISAVYSF
ncbi:TonB-dependent hemoglobin/transferrin/lactoferrin family receptor [Congregibacter sp.]|uniref:TonB-dependent hemoglobin/transferrin/lactoferrin family receptor n=1 Tax=Congregibacter sp. TaxID=2744308 RepID=UPI003F6A5415